MVLATDSAPVPNGAIVYTDLSSLNTLRAAQKENPNGALLAAAQQFESLFVQMMLASMRSASLGDGIFDSQGENFYRELYDKQLAVSLAGDGGRGSTLGLTSMLMRQLLAWCHRLKCSRRLGKAARRCACQSPQLDCTATRRPKL